MSNKSKTIFSFPGGIEIRSIPLNYVIKWTDDYQTYYGTLQDALEDICEHEQKKILEKATHDKACTSATELAEVLSASEKKIHRMLKKVGKQCEEYCEHVDGNAA